MIKQITLVAKYRKGRRTRTNNEETETRCGSFGTDGMRWHDVRVTRIANQFLRNFFQNGFLVSE